MVVAEEVCELWEGAAVGGPLDGQRLYSRYPKGVLLVDRTSDQCWLYDWDDDADVFVARDGYPQPVNEPGRWRAAEQGDYDVLAAPWAGDQP